MRLKLYIVPLLLIAGVTQSSRAQQNCVADFKSTHLALGLVRFENTSVATNPEYLWDFGDNTTSTEKDPLHLYTQKGFYIVCLTVKDRDKNCEATMCRLISVDTQSTCKAWFYGKGDPPGSPTIRFYDGTLGNGYELEWDFGDGQTGRGLNPVHRYSDTGTYTVCLMAYYPKENCRDTFCRTFRVDSAGNPEPCGSEFTWYFSRDSVYFLEQNPRLYQGYYWDFGDGNTSTQRNPYHLYGNSGSYRVCLTVEDTNCLATRCQWLYFEKPGQCRADFTFEVKTDTALFGNQSAGDFLSFRWQFGDGRNQSYDRNPVHLYADSGKYKVCLFIEDTVYQCLDSICKEILIQGDTSSVPDTQPKPPPKDSVIIYPETEEHFPSRIQPNPVQKKAQLYLEQWDNRPFVVYIFSEDGKKAYRSQEFNQSPAALDLSNLVSGFYIYKVVSEGNMVSAGKFVME